MTSLNSNKPIFDNLNYESNDYGSNLDEFPVVTVPNIKTPSTFYFDTNNESNLINEKSELMEQGSFSDDSKDKNKNRRNFFRNICKCCK